MIERGLLVDVFNENLFLEKGIIQLSFNQYDDALDNLNEALKINPKLSQVKIFFYFLNLYKLYKYY